MPLITLYAIKGCISPKDKEVLVKRVTGLYKNSMPEFYVVIVFKDLEKGDFFMGGKPVDGNFVRITHEHLAIHFEALPKGFTNSSRSFLDRASAIFTDVFSSRGVGYEMNVIQGPRELWRVDGLQPPPSGSEEEKAWMQEGKTSRWSGDGFKGVERILNDNKL